MNMVDIILKKRDGGELTAQETALFVQGVTDGSIPDYQIAALMMAMCIRGTSLQEAVDITDAMTRSGETIDLSPLQCIVTDKHSTGGVADTTTLLVVPMVASCGGTVLAMSGRGLGHTGGTLDKMESIRGYRTAIDGAPLLELLRTVGGAITGQTDRLAPADRRMYALRDVTGTVENSGLIAGSILSKKLASGTNAIILDIKTGNGAFMKDIEDSFAQAHLLVQIGTQLGRRMIALITDMNQPLGRSIGNGLDVVEVLALLRAQKMDSALMELSIVLSAAMLCAAGIAPDETAARAMIVENVKNGAVLRKFYQMVQAQGGDTAMLDHPEQLISCRRVVPVHAAQSGYITAMDCVALGRASQKLGAGRVKAEDNIDSAVGIMMHVRRGDAVQEGDLLGEFYVNDESQLDAAIQQFTAAIAIGKTPPAALPLIYGTVTKEGEKRWT